MVFLKRSFPTAVLLLALPFVVKADVSMGRYHVIKVALDYLPWEAPVEKM